MTPTRLNAESAFEGATGVSLPGWVREQFREDPDVAWRELERRVTEESNSKCSVTHVTLKSWYEPIRDDVKAKRAEAGAA